MRRILWAIILSVGLATLAIGGSSTLQVKDGAGALQNMGVTTDGSGNFYSNQVIVDGTAAANKAAVSAAGAIKVDGSAVTQPVSGAVTTTPPSNASSNVSQFAGTNVSTGTGVGGAGIPRVTVSSDSFPATQPVSGTVTTTPPSNASSNVAQYGGTNVVTGTGASGAGIPRVTVSNDSQVKPWDGTNTIAVKASGTNAATTDTAQVVALSPNPSSLCTSVKAINQTGATDLVTSTNKLHICGVVLVSATAQNISLVEGTGATCGTGTAGLIGGTTASVAVAANGGLVAVSERAWLVSQTTADHICLLQSGAGNVSGVMTYTDHN